MIATAKVISCGSSEPEVMASTGKAAIKPTSGPKLMAMPPALSTMMSRARGCR
jgi:hypothetical protein